MVSTEQRSEPRSQIAAGPLRHVRLEDEAALAAEREPWDAMVREHYQGNPFLAMDWHLTWLRHFGKPPEQPHYLKILEQDRPVAYIPLCLRRERFHGIPLRVLGFAGNVYSPVNCPVIGHADRQTVMDYVVRGVLPELRWDLLRATDLPPELPGMAELRNALVQAGHRVAWAESIGNWVYEGRGITAQEYFSQLKYNVRSDTRRFPKKLATLGEVKYKLVRGDLSEAHIDAYRQVYGRSWKQPELDPTFHPDVLRATAASGLLRLGFLMLDDRPIATQIWLMSEGRGYVVKTAYDEEFRPYSPGTILTWWIIEQLISTDGMGFFDYLKGDENYKKYWTNSRRERLTLLAFPRNLRGRLLYELDQRVLPWVRRHPVLNRCKAMLARRQGGTE